MESKLLVDEIELRKLKGAIVGIGIFFDGSDCKGYELGEFLKVLRLWLGVSRFIVVGVVL